MKSICLLISLLQIYIHYSDCNCTSSKCHPQIIPNDGNLLLRRRRERKKKRRKKNDSQRKIETTAIAC